MLNLELENKPYECVVEIHCTPTNSAENITAIRIKRRIYGTLTWTQIHEKAISATDDMSFVYRDTKARSQRKYDYILIPVVNGTENVGTIGTVASEFSSIYLSDVTAEWVCHFNAQYSFKRNSQVGYVKPLASKHPKAIRNSSQDYHTGSITGLFIPKDTSNKYQDASYISRASQAYRDSLMEFLCNGKPKLIKTGEGHMWMVSIDGEVTETNSQLSGAAETQFNWTEIDSVTNGG